MEYKELPNPVFDEPAEDFAPSTNESQCVEEPHSRPGVKAFSYFVTDHLGGRSGGIVRHCVLGVPAIDAQTRQPKPSGHYTGSSWDWMMNASDPDEAARAEKLIEWLFANNHEMWRRLGLAYLIWNGRSWSTYRKDWKDYTGSSPHTDHIHFSFGDKGADGDTSFFRWLASNQPVLPPPFPVKPGTDTHYGWLLFGLLIGVASPIAIDLAVSRWPKKTSRKSTRRA